MLKEKGKQLKIRLRKINERRDFDYKKQNISRNKFIEREIFENKSA